MTGESGKPGKPGNPRLQLLLIAAVFVVPVLLAAWFASGRGPAFSRPTVNAGELISPPVPLGDSLQQADWRAVPGYWRALVLADGQCGPPCGEALRTLTQLRDGLGRKALRLELLLLAAAPQPPEEVRGIEAIAAEPGAVAALRRRLDARLAPELRQPGTIFLLDWRGDLMMAYPPGSGPAPIAADLERLYKTLRVD